VKGAASPPELDLASARLDDYVRGTLDDEAAAGFEEDLFERALSGAALEVTFRAHLESALRTMDERGTIDVWLTAAGVERLRARPELRVSVYELDVERPVLPVIPPGTDLLVTRIPVDLTGVRRLEAEVIAADGRLLKCMPDITFDVADGAVFACCEVELARIASGAQETVTRVYSIEEGGRRLVLELPML
jgi:hypothetical protein